jgi:hypothetical protein
MHTNAAVTSRAESEGRASHRVRSLLVQPTRVERVPVDRLRGRFGDFEMLVGFEGGAVYVAEDADEFALIASEAALADLLDEEDRKLVATATAYFFASAEERQAYAEVRGWTPRPRY